MSTPAKHLRTVPDERESTPRQVAFSIFQRCKGDYDAAEAALIEHAKRHPDVREWLVREGARYIARGFASDLRASATECAPVTPGKANAGYMQAMRAGFLAEFSCPGGKPLGECTRSDCKEAVEYYSAQELGMRKQRRFWEALGKKIPEGRKVREVFTDAQAKRLHQEATR